MIKKIKLKRLKVHVEIIYTNILVILLSGVWSAKLAYTFFYSEHIVYMASARFLFKEGPFWDLPFSTMTKYCYSIDVHYDK